MNIENIGNFIANLRKKKGLTQLELANLLNVSDKTISKWETGRSVPDVLLLTKLSEVLDVSVNELLNGGIISNDNYKDIIENNTISMLKHSNEEIKRKNKIILGLIISFIISFFIAGGIYILSANDDIKFYEQEINYVDESNIRDYEHVLKELYESEYTDDDFKKIALLDVKKMLEEFTGFLYENQTLSSYLTGLERQYKDYYEFNKEYSIFNLHNVVEGDYYNLAKKILIDKNEEVITQQTIDCADSIYGDIEFFITWFFIVSFIASFIYYVFYIKFITKNYWIKSLVKYVVFLLGLFLLNCVFSLLLDTIYNNLGNIYTFFDSGIYFTGNFFERGIFNIWEILIIMTIGIILNLLFNLKNIIKVYKRKNSKKVNY